MRRNVSGSLGIFSRRLLACLIILGLVSQLKLSDLALEENGWAYDAFSHPFINPARVNSPTDGLSSNSVMARQVTSSSSTWISRKKFSAPSGPMASGWFFGSSSKF